MPWLFFCTLLKLQPSRIPFLSRVSIPTLDFVSVQTRGLARLPMVTITHRLTGHLTINCKWQNCLFSRLLLLETPYRVISTLWQIWYKSICMYTPWKMEAEQKCDKFIFRKLWSMKRLFAMWILCVCLFISSTERKLY